MSISLFCVVSSYAAGFGGGQRGGTFGTSGFGTSYVSTYLSYDALSDLCLEVNYNLQHNVYASDGLPSSGNYAATIVSRNDGYYIGVYKNGSYIWFRNPSGGFYIAKFDSDSTLSSIDDKLQTLINLISSGGSSSGSSGSSGVSYALTTKIYTCGYSTDPSGNSYPTQTISLDIANQIIARLNSEMVGQVVYCLLRSGTSYSSYTLNYAYLSNSGRISLKLSNGYSYELCDPNRVFFVVDDTSTYACGYLSDSSGVLYSTQSIPYDSASQIVASLNLDMGKPVRVLFQDSTSFSSFKLSYAYISTSGYISLMLNNGYCYNLCDKNHVLFTVDRSFSETVESALSSIIIKLNSLSLSSPINSVDLTTLESTASNIESTLSNINDKLDNTATSIENTTVNITNNNPAYNVFYVTDENGEEHSITSVAADSLSASGKLLQFLYKLVVDGALSGVDSSVDGLNDFFFDSAPSSIVEGVTVWD